MDCSPPGSSVHGISQPRILERVAISFSRGSSRPRGRIRVSALEADSLPLSHQGSLNTINTYLRMRSQSEVIITMDFNCRWFYWITGNFLKCDKVLWLHRRMSLFLRLACSIIYKWNLMISVTCFHMVELKPEKPSVCIFVLYTNVRVLTKQWL